jgi:hypothetical protein
MKTQSRPKSARHLPRQILFPNRALFCQPASLCELVRPSRGREKGAALSCSHAEPNQHTLRISCGFSQARHHAPMLRRADALQHAHARTQGGF